MELVTHPGYCTEDDTVPPGNAGCIWVDEEINPAGNPACIWAEEDTVPLTVLNRNV